MFAFCILQGGWFNGCCGSNCRSKSYVETGGGLLSLWMWMGVTYFSVGWRQYRIWILNTFIAKSGVPMKFTCLQVNWHLNVGVLNISALLRCLSKVHSASGSKLFELNVCIKSIGRRGFPWNTYPSVDIHLLRLLPTIWALFLAQTAGISLKIAVP